VKNDRNILGPFCQCPPFSAFYFARKLKKKFNIPIVVDYRDLWYGSYYAFYPTPVHRLLHKRMEYNALKSAIK
jgi:hypothetical protein